MNDNRKRELAFLYVAGALGPDEKPAVFELILRDETFRRYLKEEVELGAALQRMYTGLEPSDRMRLYANIKRSLEQEEADSEPELSARLVWYEWALRIATPPLVLPLMKTMQRMCLV